MYLTSIGVLEGPVLLFGIIAIVLALVRPLPPSARLLLVLGGCLLAGSRLSAIFWELVLTRIASRADYSWIPPLRVLGYIPSMIELAGIAFLIGAALAGRSDPPP